VDSPLFVTGVPKADTFWYATEFVAINTLPDPSVIVIVVTPVGTFP
jgi:hypothetical protein